MLGEIALYAFVMLVATGVFLSLNYVPSDETVTYTGSYAPLQGRTMGAQYESVLRIVFDLPAGNLLRQTHHWAANVFVVAIALHLARICLTGAFRRPRELNYLVGVTMLALALVEGFLGYSLIDDLLSGMGLAIAYSVAGSIPFVGGDLAILFWGGEYPGSSAIWPRMEILHVLLIPVAIGGLLTVHLVQVIRQHHTQFPGGPRGERAVVGTPLWAAYALRSIGLFLIVAGLLLLLGGLVQINPIWLWGPYETALSTNGAQPDWYLGWLIGALRLMPPLEVRFGDYVAVPNPFWGGALYPLVVFGILYLWPWIDKRRWGDRARHETLDRPRDNPRRTASFAALATWVFVILFAGSVDRFAFRTLISYEAQIWFLRGAAIAGPVVAYLVTRRLCEELRARERHPLRGWSGEVVRARDDGGWAAQPEEAPTDEAAGEAAPPR
nr:cytochrome b [Conexibacter arvalis]